ncbi:MAG: hypothetical protein ACE5F2_02250 [Candidatus Paceibacteria bacterium]
MSTLSVPLNAELEKFIDQMVKEHEAETKAGVVRRVLYEFAERKAIDDVLLASEEAKKGEVVKGNTDKILGKFMNKK